MQLHVRINDSQAEQKIHTISFLEIPDLEARVSVNAPPPPPLQYSLRRPSCHPKCIEDADYKIHVVATPHLIDVPDTSAQLSAHYNTTRAKYLFRLRLPARGLHRIALGQFLPKQSIVTVPSLPQDCHRFIVPILGTCTLIVDGRQQQLASTFRTDGKAPLRLEAHTDSFVVIVMEGTRSLPD